MNTPEEIKTHAPKFHAAAWTNYTLAELGDFVHLLTKRAGHRTEPEKRAKDLQDARNYWLMIGAHLDALDKA